MMFLHFLKIIFEISASKRSKIQKKNLAKKKLNFWGTRFAPRSQTECKLYLIIFRHLNYL
jgi:hypothetical protein